VARFQKTPRINAGKKAAPASEKAQATMNRIVAGFCEATLAASTATTSSSDFETTSRHCVVASGRKTL
jgi:hypothetical protein